MLMVVLTVRLTTVSVLPTPLIYVLIQVTLLVAATL